MIFLGAGASKELGVPTLQEFSELVFNDLRKLGYDDLVNQIIESLNEFHIKVDFEAVYSILEGLVHPVNSVRNAGPLTAFLIKKKSNLVTGSSSLEFLKTMREIIYNKCKIEREKRSKIMEIYDPLFKISEDNALRDNIIFNGTQYSDKPLSWVIATTNYDMAIESYFYSKNFKYVDGYESDNNPFIKNFKWEVIKDPLSIMGRVSIKSLLLKLHGSIWQFEKNGNMFKTILDPRSNDIPIDIDVGNEMMIYPTKEKQILSRKYYYFFKIFKDIEWDKLLTIGYSFRDEPINTTIIENMNSNKQATLIVFNPHPDDALQNLNYEIPENRVIKIPQYFGTKTGKKAVETLNEYLR